MRIGFYSSCPNYPLNAIFYSFRDIVPSLTKSGHQILYQMTPWDDRSDEWLKEAIPGFRYVVHRPFLHSHRYRSAFRIANYFYRKFSNPYGPIERFSPDLLILNEGKPFELVSDLRLLNYIKKAKVPYIVSYHSNSDYVLPTCEQRANGYNFYSNARRVFAYSHQNVADLIRQIGVKQLSACVLSYPQRVTAKILEWPQSGELLMACVGRLAVHDKGQDLLISALANEDVRHRKWKLTFYGKGDDLAYLKRMIDSHALTGKITFAGMQPDIESIWRENQLLVLPSRCEGDSLALTEAMALGRPVIATPVGGAKFWINDKLNGFLCENFSVTSIKNCIKAALDREFELKEMGIRANSTFNQLVGDRPNDLFLEQINLLLSEVGAYTHLK